MDNHQRNTRRSYLILQRHRRITINRERYRNAFTPTTTTEMSDAFYICRERPDINVVVLTGAGDTAFCAGGDMNVKGRGGTWVKTAYLA